MTRAAAIRVRRLQRAFQLIAADGAQSAGTPQQRFGLKDHLRIPQRRILLGKRHELAVRRAPGAAPGFCVKHECKQAQRLRLVRQQFGHEPSQKHGFLREITAGDFRVALGDEEKDRIKRQIAAAVEASLQVASRELWQRLYAAVSHLAERLQAYKVTEEGVEHPFRDSVVTNLVKLADVLPKLNVTGDPELERLAAQVRASLLVDPQELRKSEPLRTETAKTAAAIAHMMGAYMTGYLVPAPTATTTNEGRAA